MAVMVTGRAGMLGLHIARALGEQGQKVVVYSTSGAPPPAGWTLPDLGTISAMRLDMDLKMVRMSTSNGGGM